MPGLIAKLWYKRTSYLMRNIITQGYEVDHIAILSSFHHEAIPSRFLSLWFPRDLFLIKVPTNIIVSQPVIGMVKCKFVMRKIHVRFWHLVPYLGLRFVGEEEKVVYWDKPLRCFMGESYMNRIRGTHQRTSCNITLKY